MRRLLFLTVFVGGGVVSARAHSPVPGVGEFYNGIVVDFGEDCLDIDDQETFDRIGASGAAGDEDLDIQSTVFDCTTNFDESAGDTVDLSTWFLGQANNAEITHTMTGFTFIPGNTGVVPGATEQAVTAFDINGLDSWFVDVDYIGAVEDANDTRRPYPTDRLIHDFIEGQARERPDAPAVEPDAPAPEVPDLADEFGSVHRADYGAILPPYQEKRGQNVAQGH